VAGESTSTARSSERTLPRAWGATVARDLDLAEKLQGSRRAAALLRLATQLDHDAERAADATRVQALAAVLREMASQRALRALH
jgi:hypothetical protein